MHETIDCHLLESKTFPMTYNESDDPYRNHCSFRNASYVNRNSSMYLADDELQSIDNINYLPIAMHLSPFSSFNEHNHQQAIITKYNLEFAISGMRKNTALPIPYENMSLDDGCFGDDSGFATIGVDKIFLGMFRCLSSHLLHAVSIFSLRVFACRYF
jgi:hypothetical protein